MYIPNESFKFQKVSSFKKFQVSESFKFDFVELKVQKNVVSLLNHPVAQLLSHITRHCGKADELLNKRTEVEVNDDVPTYYHKSKRSYKKGKRGSRASKRRATRASKKRATSSKRRSKGRRSRRRR